MCCLQVRAGTGGDEAALFAGDLLRMYEKAAALNGWKFEVSLLHFINSKKCEESKALTSDRIGS